METKEYPKPVTLSAANRALSAALRERDSLLSVNKQLVEALERCLNFIQATEGELGITLDSGEMARAAILAAKASS